MPPEAWFDHDLRVLGMRLASPPIDGRAEPGQPLLVLLNTGPDEVPFTLPAQPYATSYHGVLDTSDERPTPESRGASAAGTTVVLAPHSVQVLTSQR